MKKQNLLLSFVVLLFFSSGAIAEELQIDASALGQVNSVNGDKQKFREHLQVSDKGVWGLEKLSLSKDVAGVKIGLDGRALYEQDFALNLRMEKKDKGYLRVKGDSARHYYDSSNVYYFNPDNVTNPATELPNTLKTDRNNYAAELGVTLGGTKLYFGSERDERKGNENLFWGGWIRDGAPNIWILWVNPLERQVNHSSNRFYLGLDQSIQRFTVSLQQELVKVYGNSFHVESGFRRDQATKIFDRVYSSDINHITHNTRVGFEGDVIDKKLNLDLQYQFSETNNRNNYDSDALKPTGARHYDEHTINFVNNEHSGDRYLHSLKATLTGTGLDVVTPFLTVEYENSKDDNGSVRREEGSNATTADNNPNTVDEEWFYRSLNREIAFNTRGGLLFSFIPKTRFNLQIDNEDSEVTYDWNADFQRRWFGTGNNASTLGDWRWNATTSYNRKIYSTWVRTYPLHWLSGYGKFKYIDQSVSLVNTVDYMENKLGDPEYGWPSTNPRTDLYYPGRIGDTTKKTYEFTTSMQVTPLNFLVLRPRFDWVSSSFKAAKEPIQEVSKFNSKLYGLSVDLLPPASGLAVTVNLSKRNSLTETLANSYTSSLGKNPMTGAADTSFWGGLIGSFNNDASTVDGLVSYQISSWVLKADGGRTNSQGNIESLFWWTGLGLEYKLNENFSTRVKGTYYGYSEENNAGINDYNANTVVLAVSAKF